jgi:hypothetical protein
LRRRQRLAVARKHVPDLALRDRHQRHLVKAILKRHQHMPAAAKELGLKAGLTVQRDDAVLDRSGRAPELLDDTDAVVRDVAKREQEHDERKQRKQNPEYKRHGYTERHDEQSFQVVWGLVVSGLSRTSHVSGLAGHRTWRLIYSGWWPMSVRL